MPQTAPSDRQPGGTVREVSSRHGPALPTRAAAIEDVALGRDEHPEVGAPALLLGLDEDAGGVGTQVGLGEGVVAVSLTASSRLSRLRRRRMRARLLANE